MFQLNTPGPWIQFQGWIFAILSFVCFAR